MDNMSMNTELEGTTPIEPEMNQEPTEESAEGTAPQDQSASDGTTVTEQQNDGAAAVEPVAEPFLSIRYNHETRGLSQSEAADLAQKGLYYGALHDKLDYVAAQMDTTVDELVNGLLSKQEESYRQNLVDKLGEDSDLIEGLMQVYRNNQKEKYERTVAKRETSITSRLADEFTELKAEFPELKEFRDLPESVQRKAAEGMNLTAAFLLFKHQEEKKSAAAQISAKAAQKSSAGSSASVGEPTDPAVDAFLSGLMRR